MWNSIINHGNHQMSEISACERPFQPTFLDQTDHCNGLCWPRFHFHFTYHLSQYILYFWPAASYCVCPNFRYETCLFVGQDGFSLGDVGTVAANDSIVLICFPICKGNLKTMMRSALIIFVSLLFIDIHHGSTFVSDSKPTKLYSGVGIATNYSWTEDPFELEIHVNIPEGTIEKE